MKLRSAALPWLLALLLLLSQQLAVTHAVSHLAAAHAHSSQEKQLPADQACAQCLAFAQIGSALAPSAVAIVDNGVNDAARVSAPTRRADTKLVRAYRARAPPSPA